MGAPDDLLYEYAVIRYVPRVDREEFVNIGLIMMNKRHKWMKALVLFDEARLQALFPKADLECLKNQSRLFEMKNVPGKDLPVEEKYRWLTAVKSACLQVSPSHPAILTMEVTDSSSKAKKNGISVASLMEEEFTRLFSLLVL